MSNQNSLSKRYIELSQDPKGSNTVFSPKSENESYVRRIWSDDSSASYSDIRDKPYIRIHSGNGAIRGRKPYDTAKRMTFYSWTSALCCRECSHDPYRSTSIQTDYESYELSVSQSTDGNDVLNNFSVSSPITFQNLKIKTKTSTDLLGNCETAVKDVLLLGEDRSDLRNKHEKTSKVRTDRDQVPLTINFAAYDKYIVPMMDLFDLDAIESSRSMDEGSHNKVDGVHFRDKKGKANSEKISKATKQNPHSPAPPSMIEIQRIVSVVESVPDDQTLTTLHTEEPKEHSASTSSLKSIKLIVSPHTKIETPPQTPKQRTLVTKDTATQMITPTDNVKKSNDVLPQLVHRNMKQFESRQKSSNGISMQVKKGLKTDLPKNSKDSPQKSLNHKVETKMISLSRKKAKKNKEKLKRSKSSKYKTITVARKKIDDGNVGGNETPQMSCTNTSASSIISFGEINPHTNIGNKTTDSSCTSSTLSSTTKRIYSSDPKSQKWYKQALKEDGKQKRKFSRNQKKNAKFSSINAPLGTLDSDDLESTASWEVVFTINSKGRKNKKINLPTPINQLLGDINEIQNEV